MMKQKNAGLSPARAGKISYTKPGKLSWAVKYGLLSLLLIVYIFPFFMVLINAFKEKVDVIKNPLALIGERGFILSNFAEAVQKMNFFRALGNSLLVTGVSVVLIVLFSAMAAYRIARSDWLACKIFFVLMIVSLAIPFQILMIPLVSIYGSMLHILNHRATLIFMHVGFGVSMSCFLFQGSIKSNIPLELEESAAIDGCGSFRTFFGVVLPLLKPTIATTVIINTLNLWNDYLLPSLILGDSKLHTLPIATRVFYGAFSSDLGLLLAALVLMILPILVLYLFLQKHIIEGVVAGAVKG